MNKTIPLAVMLAAFGAVCSQAQVPSIHPPEESFRTPPINSVVAYPPVAGSSWHPGVASVGSGDFRAMEPPPATGALDDRIARMEAENQRMQAELHAMRMRLANLDSPPPGPEVVPINLQMAAPANPPAAAPPVTMPQVQGEIKRLMWTKGDIKIVPYGWLWGSMVQSTHRTHPGNFTLWALSETTQSEAESIFDARSTRLGVDVAGPQLAWLGCASPGGKAEIDFQNPLTILNTPNQATVQLRHAYAELKNEEFRFLVGQTSDLISPLNPGTLMFSVGWAAGNIGFRHAQVRAERYYTFSDVSLMALQASLSQNVFSDPLTRAGSTLRGESAGWPIVQGRIGWVLGERKGPEAQPISFGVSGHIGQTEFEFLDAAGFPVPGFDNLMRNTWSLNADLRVPITQRFGFQCEFFTGENLGQFFGGIQQGIDNSALFGYNEIRSTGGWAELWWDLNPRLHTHFGYSIDDPLNSDLHVATARIYNQFFFTNIVYDVTKQFIVGVEASSWKTHFLDPALLPGEPLRFEFVAKYGF